jgi:hypothetical protein
MISLSRLRDTASGKNFGGNGRSVARFLPERAERPLARSLLAKS